MSQTVNTIAFSEATPADLEELIANIRQEDRRELELDGHFLRFDDAIRLGFAASEAMLSAKVGGRLMIMYGAIRTGPREQMAAVWGLGTDLVRLHARDFIRASRTGFDMLADKMPGVRLFINAMPEKYTTYRKWAERHLGAEFADHSNIMATGEPFVSFGIWKKGA